MLSSVPSHALCVVIDDLKLYDSIKDKMGIELFNAVHIGSAPKDFNSVISDSKDPLVLFIQGRQSANVIKHLAEGTNGRVRWVHSFFTGMDSFGLNNIADTLIKHNIPLSNTRSVFTTSLAEHVIYSCMYFNRQMWRTMANKHAKVWDRFTCKEMKKQRMGIIGCGDIGSACGRAAMSLGMDVIGLRRRSTTPGDVDMNGIPLVCGPEGLNRVLQESDFVVNVMPLTSENKHMLNKSHFSKMRKDAVFINIGRGATVVEDDLIDCLEQGVIAGAALDVFEKEPLPLNSRLWSIGDDKLLLTPHNADITMNSFNDAAELFSKLAKDFVIYGKPVTEYLVDAVKGY